MLIENPNGCPSTLLSWSEVFQRCLYVFCDEHQQAKCDSFLSFILMFQFVSIQLHCQGVVGVHLLLRFEYL